MKIRVLFVALLMMVAANGANGAGKNYDIETIEDHARVREFKYLSYEKLCDEVQERAENEMLSTRQVAQEIAALPKGGIVSTCLLGDSWGLANGPNWLYIVTDMAGKELFRGNGHSQKEPAPVYERIGSVSRRRSGSVIRTRERKVAPEKTPFGASVFSSTDAIRLQSAVPDSFKVYVVDISNKKRCSYLLTKEK
ncbi:MAG: hypothetical protein FDX21_08620 [Chlorobium sp.]|nr:MAG: hypothetical protein FDX21_08620 [Chlorobium sp.]